MRLRRAVAVLLGGGAVAVAAAGCGVNKDEPDLIAGKKAFAEKCGACHTLARAQTKGTQGPNLDAAFSQALASGMERDGIRGAVAEQIKHPAIVPKGSEAYMPPDVVKGEDVDDVAAYVAQAVARRGEDQGLLAEAVPKAGAGEPAVEKDGELEIKATAQLAYETDKAEAKAGDLTIKSPNPSGTPHNIALEGGGVNEQGKVVQNGGVSEIQASVKKGEYTFFCTVPGHREAGMEGKLTVE